MANEQKETLQLVTFQLGEEKYGIDIMDVKEIQRSLEIRAIPNAPLYIEGIANLRGTIIPIINLHQRFHLNHADLSEEELLLKGTIIININNMLLGVIIDKISMVMTVQVKSIQPPPQMISGIGSEYIQGVVNEEGEYLIILDISRLFNPIELQRISSISE